MDHATVFFILFTFRADNASRNLLSLTRVSAGCPAACGKSPSAPLTNVRGSVDSSRYRTATVREPVLPQAARWRRDAETNELMIQVPDPYLLPRVSRRRSGSGTEADRAKTGGGSSGLGEDS